MLRQRRSAYWQRGWQQADEYAQNLADWVAICLQIWNMHLSSSTVGSDAVSSIAAAASLVALEIGQYCAECSAAIRGCYRVILMWGSRD
jgi:hypothetical protein